MRSSEFVYTRLLLLLRLRLPLLHWRRFVPFSLHFLHDRVSSRYQHNSPWHRARQRHANYRNTFWFAKQSQKPDKQLRINENTQPASPRWSPAIAGTAAQWPERQQQQPQRRRDISIVCCRRHAPRPVHCRGAGGDSFAVGYAFRLHTSYDDKSEARWMWDCLIQERL